MASSGIEKSSLSIGNIQKSILSFDLGLQSATKSIGDINLTLFSNIKKRKESIKREDTFFRKKRQIKAAKLNEEVVETQNVNNYLKRDKPKTTLEKSNKGFLGRILDFIGVIATGWLVLNFKNIIKAGSGLIARIQSLFGILSNFTAKIMGFFSGLFKSLNPISNMVEGDNEDLRVQGAQLQTSLSLLEKNLNGLNIEMNNIYREFDAADRGTRNLEGEPSSPNTSAPPSSLIEIESEDSDEESDEQLTPLLDLIGSVEGGYNSIAPGDTNDQLTEMTIAEAAEAIGDNTGAKGPIGRYQLTRPIEQAALAGLGPNDLFSKANQDKIALALIRNRGVTPEMIKNDPIKAGNLLAKEWAGLPLLSDLDGMKRGQSYYSGIGNNKAGVTAEKFESVLNQISGVKPKGDSREGYTNQRWDRFNWIPDDWFNKKDKDISSLNMNKGPKIVYVPIDDSRPASKPVTSGNGHSGGGIVITSTSKGLNSDDIIIQELAYT